MNVIAVNGSPRKYWNTATLLQHALNGAAEQGATTRLIHLYDLEFKGCTSCFACKRKGADCSGLCAVKDGLTDVLKAILECDVLLLGAPIYFGDVPGEMRSFLERLLFPINSYNAGERSVFRGTVKSAFFYTMNVGEEQALKWGYGHVARMWEAYLRLLNGGSEYLFSHDTYQFKDYSLYEASRFDEPHKARVRAEQFPLDCQRAFEIGSRLASRVAE